MTSTHPLPALTDTPELPMRILIGADTYAPDINGAARFAERLAHGLAGRGHDVHVVCPANENRWPWQRSGRVTLHRVASHRTPFHPSFRICLPPTARPAVAALLDDVRPDVVHTQAHFVVGRAVVTEARHRGLPILATNHFMPENLLGYLKCPQPLARAAAGWAWRDLARVYRNADLVTAPTPRAVQLLRHGGFHAEALAVSCGIDLDGMGCRDTAPANTAEESEPPTVLFVGRLDKEKHVDELIAAMARLPEDLPARAEIVGDGSCRWRLQEQARELGVVGRVRFRGFVDDAELQAAYRRCAVFCMPGVAELQSLATMEAMAAAKPVIAADAVALPHLVRSGENGWLYPPGDVPALADRLVLLLGDRPMRQRMAAASRQIIAGHDFGATLDTFERLYRRIAAVRAFAR